MVVAHFVGGLAWETEGCWFKPAKHGRCSASRGRFQNKFRYQAHRGPFWRLIQGCVLHLPVWAPPWPPPKNPEMLFELLKTFCCLTKLVQQPDIHASIFLKSILAHQLRLCLIIKKVWGPLQPLLVRKDQRRGDCSPLPVGVVSEFIACCALCGRNFFFISQRTAWLIIKALSIAWYNFDSVSLQLNVQYNYVFKKQSYSSC